MYNYIAIRHSANIVKRPKEYSLLRQETVCATMAGGMLHARNAPTPNRIFYNGVSYFVRITKK